MSNLPLLWTVPYGLIQERRRRRTVRELRRLIDSLYRVEEAGLRAAHALTVLGNAATG